MGYRGVFIPMLATTIVRAIPTYPRGVCDRCLARDLGRSLPMVRTTTGTLGLTKGYGRCPANCPECGKQGHVIRSCEVNGPGPQRWLR
jgi:hypothetical protein